MSILLWILQSILALVFLTAGFMKLATPKQTLEKKMTWAVPFQPWMLKGLGALEVLGALGLTLPAATRIAPLLTPIAACGLLVIMAGAVTIHMKRHEHSNAYMTLALGICAALIAWGRFGPFAL